MEFTCNQRLLLRKLLFENQKRRRVRKKEGRKSKKAKERERVDKLSR
jgi:hypothetical protein